MKVKINNKKILVSIVAIISLLALLFISYWFFFRPPLISPDGINYSPATQEDKRLNDKLKEELTKAKSSDQDQQPRNNATKNTVSTVISAWGQPNGPGTDFTLHGYITDIIESDGTCTLTLSKGSTQTSVSKKALQNAQSTSCGQLTVEYDKLTTGEWDAILSYDSALSRGSSEITKVEVK